MIKNSEYKNSEYKTITPLINVGIERDVLSFIKILSTVSMSQREHKSQIRRIVSHQSTKFKKEMMKPKGC